MSVYVSAHVWANSAAKGTPLLVLLAIADMANDEGHAWPSIKTLAQRARISPRNVSRAIAELVGLGELANIAHIEKGTGQRSNDYVVLGYANPSEVNMERRAKPKMSSPHDNHVTPPMTQLSSPPMTSASSHISISSTHQVKHEKKLLAPSGADGFSSAEKVHTADNVLTLSEAPSESDNADTPTNPSKSAKRGKGVMRGGAPTPKELDPVEQERRNCVTALMDSAAILPARAARVLKELSAAGVTLDSEHLRAAYQAFQRDNPRLSLPTSADAIRRMLIKYPKRAPRHVVVDEYVPPPVTHITLPSGETIDAEEFERRRANGFTLTLQDMIDAELKRMDERK